MNKKMNDQCRVWIKHKKRKLIKKTNQNKL